MRTWLRCQNATKIHRMAIKHFKPLMAGLARVDFLKGNVRPGTNELNTAGLTGFQAIQRWEASGLVGFATLEELINRASRNT